MPNHWIIIANIDRRGSTVYNRVDFDPGDNPRCSYVLADEIDGMPLDRAVRVLEQMYERVTVFAQGGMIGKGCIVCR